MTGGPAAYCPNCGTATESRHADGKERRYCPNCEMFIWQNPVPTGSVVVRDGGQALFVRRAIPPDEGEWDLPGGFLEVDESPAEGAARELAEETGLQVDPDALELRGAGHERRNERALLPVVYEVDRAETEGELTAGSDANAVRFAHPSELTPVRGVAASRYELVAHRSG